MLPRRFSIVCLILTIFGMLFSIIVAEASRPARRWDIGQLIPCIFEHGLVCSPPVR
jgi:hypothetical protein